MARRVAVPDDVRERGLLDRVDYGDAFVVDVPVGSVAGYTPAGLAELALGRAPRWIRFLVPVVHRHVLGLRLGPIDPAVAVPGWSLLEEGPDELVYGVEGGLITPRLVVRRTAGSVLVVTVLRYDRPAARLVWAVVQLLHRLVARLLLDRSARLVRADAAAGRAR